VGYIDPTVVGLVADGRVEMRVLIAA